MTSTTDAPPEPTGRSLGDPSNPSGNGSAKLSGKQIVARSAVIATIIAIAAMWIYGFGFAPDKPLAQLDDGSWSKRAEQICEVRNDLLDANAERAIAVSDGSPEQVGAAVEDATNIIEDALDEILAVRPTSARDVRLVNEWESLYRTYIADRRDVEQRLLAGEAVELNETTLNGSPISLTIGDFTKHNRMQSCSTPSR